ncbi:hypothetical protein F2Q69_00032466 [Brassica cretica]|uniref:Uncharacterized protein n=1 Tax=Brassica cretica TaxID=69181 RepID=A0A8S9RU45_BRACR|nr:hypothetical protein F2Q69_00032466 [Brassica cretica]
MLRESWVKEHHIFNSERREKLVATNLKSEEKLAPHIKVDWNKWCDEDEEVTSEIASDDESAESVLPLLIKIVKAAMDCSLSLNNLIFLPASRKLSED